MANAGPRFPQCRSSYACGGDDFGGALIGRHTELPGHRLDELWHGGGACRSDDPSDHHNSPLSVLAWDFSVTPIDLTMLAKAAMKAAR